MGELIHFPRMDQRNGDVTVAWHTYRVEAVDAVGNRHVIDYRAMNELSAARRAVREGYTVKSTTKVETK